MKPFLGIDRTVNKKNEELNGRELLVQEPSAPLAQALELYGVHAGKVLEMAKLPAFFRVVQLLCGLCGLGIASGILKAEVSLSGGYHNAPWLFWTAGGCAIVWVVLWLWGRKRAKAILGDQEQTQAFSDFYGVAKAVYREMSVPEDAPEVDVLSFFYREEDGKIKIIKPKVQAQFQNMTYKIFSDERNLYLAYFEGKYAFPLASLEKREWVKKHIQLAGWDKEEPYNKGIYKKYKIVEDNDESIYCKGYEILIFTHNGTSWGIYFPEYEKHVLDAVLSEFM